MDGFDIFIIGLLMGFWIRHMLATMIKNGIARKSAQTRRINRDRKIFDALKGDIND